MKKTIALSTSVLAVSAAPMGLRPGSTANAAASCSSITASDRMDCGYSGISQSTCESSGCCWVPYENSGGSNVPWCFYSEPPSES